jgi:hypothetical protein
LPEDQPSNTALRLSVRPGITGWAQVNGAKLVTKEEKEKFDEWYVRNASLFLDLKVVLMTLRIMGRNYLRSTEAAADLAQVQAKQAELTTLAAEPVTLEPAPRLRDAPMPPTARTRLSA